MRSRHYSMKVAIIASSCFLFASGARVHQRHLITQDLHDFDGGTHNLSMLPGHVPDEVLEATIEFSRKIAVHKATHSCLRLAYADHSDNVTTQFASLEWYEMKLMLFEQKKRGWFEFLHSGLKRMWASLREEDYVASFHEQMASAITASLDDLNGYLRLTLKTYDQTRTNCQREAVGKLRNLEQMFQGELENGCSGGCTKMSSVAEAVNRGMCREKTVEIDGTPQVCPEGTHCACLLETNKKKGAVAFAVTYGAIWGLWMAIFGVVQGSATPGPTEGALFAVFMFAKTAKGCGCKPTPCHWSEDAQVCTPHHMYGSMNPAQAVLPALGTKCVRQQDMSTVSKFFGVKGKCVLEPCTAADEDVFGKQGMNTLNCQVSLSAASIPSIEERTAKYKAKWPIYFCMVKFTNGVRANNDGDTSEALNLFLQAADEWPKTDSQRMLPVVSAANMHFKLVQLEDAKILYEKVVAEARQLRMEGSGMLSNSLAQKKMQRFENMAKFKLDLMSKGRPYQNAEYDDEMKADVEETNAELVDALMKEGLVLNRQGDTQGALKMFVEAKKISPKGHVLLSIGNMYLQLGDLRGAEDMYMRVRKARDAKTNYVYSEKHRKLAFEKMRIVWEKKEMHIVWEKKKEA